MIYETVTLSMRSVLVHAFSPCSCVQSLSMRSVLDHAFSPCPCVQSLSMRSVLVHAFSPCSCVQSLFMCSVLVHAFSPCPCVQSLFMRSVLVHAFSPCSHVHMPCQSRPYHLLQGFVQIFSHTLLKQMLTLLNIIVVVESLLWSNVERNINICQPKQP